LIVFWGNVEKKSKNLKIFFRYAKRFRIFAITLQRQTTENCSLKNIGRLP